MVGRRVRHPEILADLHAQDQLGDIPAGEEELRPQGHGLAAEGHRHGLRRGRGKVAFFVELAVVGYMDLGHQAENSAVLTQGRAVVEAAARRHRQAHRRHQVLALGCLQHRLQGRFRAPEQGGLQKEVAAGVGRQPQLRQHQYFDAPVRGLGNQIRGRLGIVGAVGHGDLRRGHGYGDKTISHRHSSRAVWPPAAFWPSCASPPPWGSRTSKRLQATW